MISIHPNVTLREKGAAALKTKKGLAVRRDNSEFEPVPKKAKESEVSLKIEGKSQTVSPEQRPKNLRNKNSYFEFTNDDILFQDGSPMIFEYLKQRESAFTVPKDYLAQTQRDIGGESREELVDWLVEIHEKMDLSPESLYLSVGLLDRHLARRRERLDALQLLGAAALFVASKYEDTRPVAAGDLVFLAKNTFSKDDVYRTERTLLRTIDFQLTVPYALTFARQYLRQALATRFARRYAEFLLELALLDHQIASVERPSRLAASAVFLALRFTDPFLDENWSSTLQPHSGYDRGELKPLARRLMDLVHRHSDRRKAVYRKFAREKYGKVAEIPLWCLMRHHSGLVEKAMKGALS